MILDNKKVICRHMEDLTWMLMYYWIYLMSSGKEIKCKAWRAFYHFLLFVAVFLGCTSTGRVGLCFLWFYVQELPKAQPPVVLVLKRLRRRGNGLKSHPTDWEKPGIQPATPGLQDIGLSPTPRRLLHFITFWQQAWYIQQCKSTNIKFYYHKTLKVFQNCIFGV